MSRVIATLYQCQCGKLHSSVLLNALAEANKPEPVSCNKCGRELAVWIEPPKWESPDAEERK